MPRLLLGVAVCGVNGSLGLSVIGAPNLREENEMSREWKAGDKIQLVGTIRCYRLGNSHVEVQMEGDSGSVYNSITKDAISHATLIESVVPEPQKLDTSKPMRNRHTGECVLFIGRLSDGRIVAEEVFNGSPQANTFWDSELKNIPEPKIMGRREAVLLSNGDTVWATPSDFWHRYQVIGRTWVEITEGDGMGGES